MNKVSKELSTKSGKANKKPATQNSLKKPGRNCLGVFSYMKKDDIPLELVRLFWKMIGQLPEKLDAHLDDLKEALVISMDDDTIRFINCSGVDITHKNISQLEKALVEMFIYDDNDPSTYQPC